MNLIAYDCRRSVAITLAAVSFGALAISPVQAIGLGNGPEVVSNTFVKKLDVAALNKLIYGNTDALSAASQVFVHVFRPYYFAETDAQRQKILNRQTFNCAEDLSDPTATVAALAFPVTLASQEDGSSPAVTWHRYRCTLRIHYTDELGRTVDYTSPEYHLNQLDLVYGTVKVEPAVAFQNYDLGRPDKPEFPWLGRYVQPLNLMLRDTQDAMPATAIAGVNGGYDYRVDAWQSSIPNDNICPSRWFEVQDTHQFYHHPAPRQCDMVADSLPSCVTEDHLWVHDDLGDSIVYLAPEQRAKSWRQTPFQSFNCGGMQQAAARGALILYPEAADTKRTKPSKDDVSELMLNGRSAISALGAGPLLIRNQHFVYDQQESEEQMSIDNYEVGGQTAAGFQHNQNGSITLHIVNIDGDDNNSGMHDWMTGLYMLSPYAQSDGAVALGNGGDATLWINPQTPAIQTVLQDSANPNNAFFEGLFINSSQPGVVSNCANFATPPVQCRARPIHDGLFVYSR